jgi:integrase
MASRKWNATSYPGVRYREHPKRKHGVGPDKYFSIYYRLEGKRKEQGCGWASQGMTAKKAAAILAEIEENIRLGQGHHSLEEKREQERKRRDEERKAQEQEERDNLPFGDFFMQSYLPQAQADKSPNSARTEEQMFRTWIAPAIGNRPLKGISPIHLEKIKKSMADAGRAPRTIQYALAVVRQSFNHAKRIGLFDGDNPTSKVKKPSVDNRRLRFLTHEEAGRLLGALREKSESEFDASLLSLHCGLRAGEIFSLTWGDVDLERGRLTLRDTKSGKSRVAIMTGDVKSMLEQKERGGHNELVFPGVGGKKRAEIGHSFDRAVKELGLNNGVTDRRQKVVFHSLRHTYASWLVEQGVDLYTVKELMGHSTLSMTERYAHLAPDTLQRAVRQLENGMEKAKHRAVLSLEK